MYNTYIHAHNAIVRCRAAKSFFARSSQTGILDRRSGLKTPNTTTCVTLHLFLCETENSVWCSPTYRKVPRWCRRLLSSSFLSSSRMHFANGVPCSSTTLTEVNKEYQESIAPQDTIKDLLNPLHSRNQSDIEAFATCGDNCDANDNDWIALVSAKTYKAEENAVINAQRTYAFSTNFDTSLNRYPSPR